MSRLIDHLFILLTILFTVYSQFVMRWQVAAAGPLPADVPGKVSYLITLLMNPWVLSGVGATFFAGVSWMLAMTKFEVSYAYPFVSMTYIFVLAAGALLLHESMSPAKLLGSTLIVLGIIVIARG